MIDKVTNRHRRLMDALVRDGMTPREVSTQFGITESRLAILRKSPLWQEEEKKMREDHVSAYQAKIASLLPKAVQALDDIVVESREIEVTLPDGTLDTKLVVNSPKDRLAAARDILSRSGIPEGFKLETNITHNAEGMLTALQEIRDRKANLYKMLGIKELPELPLAHD